MNVFPQLYLQCLRFFFPSLIFCSLCLHLWFLIVYPFFYLQNSLSLYFLYWLYGNKIFNKGNAPLGACLWDSPGWVKTWILVISQTIKDPRRKFFLPHTKPRYEFRQRLHLCALKPNCSLQGPSPSLHWKHGAELQILALYIEQYELSFCTFP